jgi:uncharacterized membrane protein YphA (DoxX/SURF4 family)
MIYKTGKLFHLSPANKFPGFDKFDDSEYGISFFYTCMLVSCFATIVWSAIERKRNNYQILFGWLDFYLRYFLAAYLFGYGFIKIFPSQFQAITASRLVMRVGDQTPMLLAWNFMGYSPAFNHISGMIEVVAGLLLLFRRTATLGAIMATGTFSFVAMLDYCFDVPIKLLVTHLLLLSFTIVCFDLKRLVNVLVLNKPTTGRDLALTKNKTGRVIIIAIQLVFITGILYKTISESIATANEIGQNAKPVPLYGIYKTVYFTRNHDTVPPLQTDPLRWKQLVIDGGSWHQSAIIEFNNDEQLFATAKVDTIKKELSIQPLNDTTIHYKFQYRFMEKDQMLLRGKWNADSIIILLHKYYLDSFKLYRERNKRGISFY